MSTQDDRGGPFTGSDPASGQDTTVLPAGGSGSTTSLPAAGSGEVTGAPQRTRRPAWNSGADLGLLVLRLVLGGTFIAHGCQKLFGLFGGPGIGGFAAALAGYGFRAPGVLSVVTGVTELLGGALVVLGLLTPLAAAGLLGIMVNTIILKWSDGFFAGSGGFELDLALAGMATALILSGPGRAALDRNRAWFRHPVVSGWSCLLVGLGVGLVCYLLLRG